jgi:hypothetical protein
MPGSRSRGPDRFGSHYYYRPFHDRLYRPSIPLLALCVPRGTDVWPVSVPGRGAGTQSKGYVGRNAW